MKPLQKDMETFKKQLWGDLKTTRQDLKREMRKGMETIKEEMRGEMDEVKKSVATVDGTAANAKALAWDSAQAACLAAQAARHAREVARTATRSVDAEALTTEAKLNVVAKETREAKEMSREVAMQLTHDTELRLDQVRCSCDNNADRIKRVEECTWACMGGA